MPSPTTYDQLGRFIVKFQRLERQVVELTELLAGDQPVITAILTAELDFSKRVKTVDVLYSYFVELRVNSKMESSKKAFHKLCSTLLELAGRRNELVHSVFTPWLSVQGMPGLIRENARLSSSKGALVEIEEELLPDSLDAEIVNLSCVSVELEEYRVKIIDMLYPSEA